MVADIEVKTKTDHRALTIAKADVRKDVQADVRMVDPEADQKVDLKVDQRVVPMVVRAIAAIAVHRVLPVTPSKNAVFKPTVLNQA